MSLAAFPGKLEEVKLTTQWRDELATAIRNKTGVGPSPEDFEKPDAILVQEILPNVLRALHGIHAEKLPNVGWSRKNGQHEHLIQDSDLRVQYGNLIGKIAASHWWNIEDLPKQLPPRVNAANRIPATWTINPIKIACLLRVADAAHIDHRRAPTFLMALKSLSAESAKHWTFQNKLQKPSIDKGFICFTGGPFELSEADAWWLCYEMLRMIDGEIRTSNNLLDNHGLPLFAAKGVLGINSPTVLVQYIRTESWQPVDASLRVSNVPDLVRMLGGHALYGNNCRAPLRELIQNAADAVRARRFLHEGGPEGLIKISLTHDDETWRLHIEDNGVGMSPNVLTGALIDFGRSLWRSSDARKEFPGLQASRFEAVGKFGIGFFSVFMLGDVITVTSRRYDQSANETNTLEFLGGTTMRPLLRKAKNCEKMYAGGTKISITLKEPPNTNGQLLHLGVTRDNGDGPRPYVEPLRRIVGWLCPTLDVSVETIEPDGNRSQTVIADDWMTMKPNDLLNRISTCDMSHYPHFPEAGESMEIIHCPSTGNVVGRAYIVGVGRGDCNCITIGGVRADRSHLPNVSGVFCGQAITADRSSAKLLIQKRQLASWASSQAKHLIEPKDGNWWTSAARILAFSGNSSHLPVAKIGGTKLSFDNLVTRLQSTKFAKCVFTPDLEYDSLDDEVISPTEFNRFSKDFCVISRRV